MEYDNKALTRTGAALLAATAAVGLIAGCSDSKSSKSDSSNAAATQSLHDAALRQYRATMNGDYEADWNFMSQRCRATMFHNNFQSFAAQVKQVYADRAPQLAKMGDPELTVKVDGDSGTVKTNAPDGKSPNTEAKWTKINGQWVIDAC